MQPARHRAEGTEAGQAGEHGDAAGNGDAVVPDQARARPQHRQVGRARAEHGDTQNVHPLATEVDTCFGAGIRGAEERSGHTDKVGPQRGCDGHVETAAHPAP